MVIYIPYVYYVWDVLRNVLELSLKTVQIGLSCLDITIVEVLVAFMTDYKFKHNSPEKIEQL